jgi:hypothetical protein
MSMHYTLDIDIYWISFQDIPSDMFSNFSLLCLRPCLGWRVAFWAKSRNSAAQHVLTRTQQMSRFRLHASNTSMSQWQLLNARGTCKGPARDSQGTHEELPKETPRRLTWDSQGTTMEYIQIPETESFYEWRERGVSLVGPREVKPGLLLPKISNTRQTPWSLVVVLPKKTWAVALQWVATLWFFILLL